MSRSVCLSEVPGRFLDQRKWKSLRKSAPKEIIALSYINAPHPGEEDPSDFFWDRPGSAADAVLCYRTGRSLLEECRSLLSEGELIATGVVQSDPQRRTPISAKEWLNLWPMFATNKAIGPNSVYCEVEIYKAALSNNPRKTLVSDCTEWLKGPLFSGRNVKKFALYSDARRALGDTLTHPIFDAAYLMAYGRQRGRPKNAAQSKR
jgi:hypothetical protein